MKAYPKYFNKIFSSVQYLNEKFGLKINNLKLSNEDKRELQKLVNEILIAIPKPLEKSSIFCNKPNFVLSHDADNIEKILTELCVFLLSNWQNKNMLTTGCKLEKYSKTIQMRSVNTFFDEIRTTKGWSILLECIGKDEFCRLLLDTVVLRKSVNDVYYQLAGPSLSQNINMHHDSEEEKLKACKPIVNQYLKTFLFDIGAHEKDLKEHLDVLLYDRKRKHKQQEDNEVPQKKIKLCRRQKKKLKEQLQSNDRIKRRKLNTDKANTIQIDRSSLLYSGSRINKQTNKVIMALPKDHLFQTVKNYDEETRLEMCLSKIFPKEFTSSNRKKKFYKRCTTINEIMKKILKNNKTIHFMTILNRNCPKKVSDVTISTASTSHFQVFHFIKQVLEKVFPLEFWGSQHNFNIICRDIKHFISRRKFEKMSMTEIIYQFKTLDCTWVVSESSKDQRVVPTELRKREELIEQALEWVFTDYIIPVIRSFFYVTDHADYGMELKYYRRDVWEVICQEQIQSLIDENYYTKLKDKAELAYSPLGVGKLRFMPKTSGLRTITNMRYTKDYTKDDVKDLDTNKILSPALNALNFEKEQDPESVGSSVLDRGLFYNRLKAYKQIMKTSDTDKFYFVKIDITNCFDNIDQQKLLSIVDNILKSNEYMRKTVKNIRPFSNSVIKKEFVSFSTASAMDNMKDSISNIKGLHKGSIMVDLNTYHLTTNANELRYLLKQSIVSNYVKYGNDYFKRKRGIPQGSCLSTSLCSFFFGQLEKEKLSFLKEDKSGILFSYVDDFLYITKNRQYARKFMNTMFAGISDYGISANKDKCMSNLIIDIEEFPWLGFKLNTKTLDISIDTTKRKRLDVLSSLTVQYSCQPSKTLLNSGVRAIKSNFYDMLMDHEMNSKETLIRNLYDNFQFAALKIETQATELAKSIIGYIDERCLLEIIIHLGQIIIPMTPKGINKSKNLQIFFKAFYDVFRRRYSRYPYLSDYLKYVLKRYDRSVGYKE